VFRPVRGDACWVDDRPGSVADPTPRRRAEEPFADLTKRESVLHPARRLVLLLASSRPLLD